MEAAGGAVRVMTAHAAKGLEAKIVFLPDTCGAPAGKHDPKLFTLGEDGALSLVWSVNRETNPAAIEDARARSREAERAEHQRLLYVAMTRAEERLYVAGYHGKNGPAGGCWHEAIRDALEPGCEKSSDADGYVLRRGGVPPLPDAPPPATAAGRPELPMFARTPTPKEIGAAPPLRPSSALEGADSFAAPGAAALTRSDAERALIGRLTHALLQHLPDCPAPRRAVAAERFLARRGAALDEETRARIIASTLALIADPRLAPLFGAQSAAEVEIVAALRGGRAVSGRIDRLAENEREVWIADFKTGRPREALDPAQLRQLALYRAALAPLYPQKLLRCFVVWTQNATAVEAEAAALDEALARAIAD
jgi:ATP-dependent helicase/nuclease subunit A